MAYKREKVFVCVWCRRRPSEGGICNAPDGDGHLYERTELVVDEEIPVNTLDKKSPPI